MLFLTLLSVLFGIGAAVAAPSNSKTSLTLLYQNNLNASDDVNHIGFILLDSFTQEDASAACSAIGESLISKPLIQKYKSDFVLSLSYTAYKKRVAPLQRYYIEGGIAAVAENVGTISFPLVPFLNPKLPVLCTQSSSQSQSETAVATASNELTITSNGNSYVGFRNQKSFRFQGIPFAEPPARFEYSIPFAGKGQTIKSTAYGAQCAQGGSGSEDCLFLNIFTPYLPAQGGSSNLRPVLFWIHGGGFEGGASSDPWNDGGNLASREDIVVVTINYRLSTLGFLAIPGTNITGNYGIADQINALEWTIKNIASFGGDPSKITIGGGSAGAGSVRTLLGSPPAKGKFQGAMAFSNLGGGVGLGLSGDYSTTYSTYYTIAQSYAVAGQNIFSQAGCTQATLDAQIACLKQIPALEVVGLPTHARYVVQDGHYVNTPQLDLENGTAAHVPVMFGIAADDGASFTTYPKTPVHSELEGIQTALGISAKYAQSIIDSGLFPYYDSANVTWDSYNVSSRVTTDKQFRCIDQATVYTAAKTGAFPASYYYQLDRTKGGYDPDNVGGPAVTPGYPFGNPYLPYFRLHGGDPPWVFGNMDRLRDANDLYSIQLTTAYFTSFVKSGQPNPETGYLKARNYSKTQEAIQKTGAWNPVKGEDGPIRLLDYPSVASKFVDIPQCEFLNYPLSYYLDGGA